MKFIFGIGIWWWNANAFYGAHLAKSLLDHGENVLLTARKGGPPFEHSMKLDIPLEDVNYDTANPILLLIQLLKLKKIIKTFKPDFLVPVTSKAHFLMSLAKIIFFRELKMVRIVADVRSPKNNISNKWFYNKWTNYIVASSETCKNRVMANTGFPVTKISVLYLGYDIAGFYKQQKSHSLRKKYGIREGEIVFLYIGRLAKEKDPQTFIRAFAEASKTLPQIKAIMSGEPLHFTFEELKSEIESAGIGDKMVLIDRVSDVRQLIQAGDVGVITSKESEVVCRIATEYMVYGLPVLGAKTNVIPEMITVGENGDIFTAGDFKNLAKLMIKYGSDKDIVSKIGKSNFQKSREQYSRKHFYSRFYGICSKLIVQ